MPARRTPFVLKDKHEQRAAGKEMDVDWTLVEDYEMALRLRQVRNKLLKEKLLRGESVCYRSSGWLLWPRVSSGDMCTYHPVYSASDVSKNDIVFCSVQPRNHFYAHLVNEKYMQQGLWTCFAARACATEAPGGRYGHV